MNKSIWWMFLPLTVVLAVFGVFFVLYPERILGEWALTASVTLLSLTAGAVVFNSMSAAATGTRTGWARLSDITLLAPAILLVAASGAVGLAIAGIEKGAMALDIVIVAGFAAMFIVFRATSASGGRRPGKSSHLDWAARLEEIARGCAMPQLRPKLLKLAGETRLLASDIDTLAVGVNQRIAGALNMIAETVRYGDEQGAALQLKRLRNLFAERETELTNQKSRM